MLFLSVILNFAKIISETHLMQTSDRAKFNSKIGMVLATAGSALALPRIVAAILEDFQTPEGIRMPKALIPYTGFEMIQ